METQSKTTNKAIVLLSIQVTGILLYYMTFRNLFGYSSLIYDKALTVTLMIKLIPKMLYFTIASLCLFKQERILKWIFKEEIKWVEISSHEFFIYKKLIFTLIGSLLVIFSLSGAIGLLDSLMTITKNETSNLMMNKGFKIMAFGIIDRLVVLTIGGVLIFKRNN